MYPHWLWITKRRQKSFYHGLYIWCSALLNIYMSLISREEPILECGCQSMWLPVLTIKWALSPGGTLRQRLLPEQAAMLCSSVSLHLIFQTVQFSPSCPCNELFRSSAKVCTFTCNQLKHVCTLSVHVHSNLYMWLPRIANSYSPKACTAHIHT